MRTHGATFYCFIKKGAWALASILLVFATFHKINYSYASAIPCPQAIELGLGDLCLDASAKLANANHSFYAAKTLAANKSDEMAQSIAERAQQSAGSQAAPFSILAQGSKSSAKIKAAEATIYKESTANINEAIQALESGKKDLEKAFLDAKEEQRKQRLTIIRQTQTQSSKNSKQLSTTKNAQQRSLLLEELRKNETVISKSMEEIQAIDQAKIDDIDSIPNIPLNGTHATLSYYGGAHKEFTKMHTKAEQEKNLYEQSLKEAEQLAGSFSKQESLLTEARAGLGEGKSASDCTEGTQNQLKCGLMGTQLAQSLAGALGSNGGGSAKSGGTSTTGGISNSTGSSINSSALSEFAKQGTSKNSENNSTEDSFTKNTKTESATALNSGGLAGSAKNSTGASKNLSKDMKNAIQSKLNTAKTSASAGASAGLSDKSSSYDMSNSKGANSSDGSQSEAIGGYAGGGALGDGSSHLGIDSADTDSSIKDMMENMLGGIMGEEKKIPNEAQGMRGLASDSLSLDADGRAIAPNNQDIGGEESIPLFDRMKSTIKRQFSKGNIVYGLRNKI